MKKNFYLTRIVFLLFCALFYITAGAQISGTVFHDVNANGTRELVNPTEPGDYGVKVSAYNSMNTLLGIVYTDASGFYIFSSSQTPASTAVRLEFVAATGTYPSRKIAPDRTNVQFVTAGAGAVNIDYAITDKKLSANTTNPYVATTKYTNGNSVSNGVGHAGTYDNLYVFPYNLSNDGGATRRAKNRFLGAVFGLAWQRESRILLMSAYLKRHCSFGPNGIGAIYQSQINTSGVPATPTLLLDITALGINVGADPRIAAMPNPASTPNMDIGVFAEVGKRGIGGIELSDDGRDLYMINMFEKKLHRINIGNPLKSSFSAANVTGNWVIPDPNISGCVWHPMALKMHEHKLYIGGVCTKEVTTNQNIADTANLRGIVYEFDPATNSFTEVLRFPLSNRRGYINQDYRYEYRNNYWNAWQNSGNIALTGPLRSGLIGATTGPNATGIYYPQPMFGAIEFDIDGSMIIGIRDRFGDQGGYANYFESGNVAGETYTTFSMGEMLRAGKSVTGFVLENAASVTSAGVTTTTPGLADNNPAQTGSFPGMTLTPWGGSYGPGGKYYYYNQNFTLLGVPAPVNSLPALTFHYVKATGGLAFLPGSNEILYTALDPTNLANTHGMLKSINLGSNAGNMIGRLHMLGNASGNPDNMGKSAAFGDLELLLDAHAVEIGNRVWADVNMNGRQDADEPGIANVAVVLRSPGDDGIYNSVDDQIWNVTTDANGNYYFDATIVNDSRRPSSWLGVSSTNSGILPGFEYKLEINSAQTPLAGMILSAVHTVADEIDNDGVYNVTNAEYIINPGGSAAAMSSFENNYNIDFGFTINAPLPVTGLDLSAAVLNSNVKLNWNTKDELNMARYIVERSTDGIQFSATASVQSKGDGSFNYQFTDNIQGFSYPNIYYRIKQEDINRKSRYSGVVSVSIKLANKITIAPNPFTSSIHLRMPVDKKGQADLRIINAAGQMVYNKKIELNEGQNSFSVDGLDNLPDGLYFLEIRSGNLIRREKMLKQ
jgi:trimeric autotransporter adhesin